MTAARVEFQTIEMEPVAPGEPPQMFGFDCPKHPRRRCEGLLIRDAGHGIPWDPKGQNGGAAQWRWDGNRESPTFTPSIDCKVCWHGYIRAGRCVDTNGRDEPDFSG